MNKDNGRRSHDKKSSTQAQPKALSPDKLTVTGKTGDVELSESELKAVSGGDASTPNLFNACATGKHFPPA